MQCVACGARLVYYTMRLRDRRKAMPGKEEEGSQQVSKPMKIDQRRWVFLAPEQAVLSVQDGNGEEQNATFVKMKHPKTEKAAMFMFSSDGRDVYELLSFKETHRSWFINESSLEDGSILMATPLDPLFLILPYLVQADHNGMYMTLDQILDDAEYTQCRRLLACSGTAHMHRISNVKGTLDMQAYRYDPDKTKDWLKAKVEQLAEKLQTKGMHVTTGAQSATFSRSSKGKDATSEDYVRYAAGIVSDYISSDLSKQLFCHIGIKEVADKVPVESGVPTEPPAKKAKLSSQNSEPEEDYSMNTNGNSISEKQKPKMTAAQRALSKVDKTGMKSITSFFGKSSRKNTKS